VLTKQRSTMTVALAVLAAACSDGTSVRGSLVSDASISADVAASSGDAIVASLGAMIGNESSGSLSTLRSGAVASLEDPTLNYSRTTVCLDADGNVVDGCRPLSSVHKIATDLAIDGSRSGQITKRNGETVTWSGAVHRSAHDTVTRNFTDGTETSRTHDGNGAAYDTTTYSDANVSRLFEEAANDSVRALTWNLPRFSNPWPVSGSIVRNVQIHVVATKADVTQTRDVLRRIEVDFPADAEGNVVLKINDKTCSLNLVTRVVSGCE
jgi:hypothetical protein